MFWRRPNMLFQACRRTSGSFTCSLGPEFILLQDDNQKSQKSPETRETTCDNRLIGLGGVSCICWSLRPFIGGSSVPLPVCLNRILLAAKRIWQPSFSAEIFFFGWIHRCQTCRRAFGPKTRRCSCSNNGFNSCFHSWQGNI